MQRLWTFLRTFAAVKCKLALLLFVIALNVSAQNDSIHCAADTTVLSTVKKGGVLRPVYWVLNYLKNTNKHEDRPFDFSFLCGPSYSATSSLGIGGGFSGLYRWDQEDLSLPKSNVSLFFNATIKGVMQVGLRGNNFMAHDRQRWNYKLTLQSIPTDFWGIGYSDGTIDANKGSYHQIKVRFKPDYLFRLAPNLYLGPMLHINYSHNYSFDSDHTLQLINGEDRDVLSAGAGVSFQYDSRDFILNASRGNFVRFEHLYFPKHLNKYYFHRTDVTYDAYRKLWKRCILAMDLHTQLNYGGDVPWTMLAFVGDEDCRMRGYYEGRYRDRNIVEGQLEMRQSFKHRLGMTVFVGCANIFSDFDHVNLRHTLPDYGVGLRWEFKPRVNIRFDVGMTRDKPGFCVNMNEAF